MIFGRGSLFGYSSSSASFKRASAWFRSFRIASTPVAVSSMAFMPCPILSNKRVRSDARLLRAREVKKF